MNKKYFLKKLILSMISVIVVLTITFICMYLIPGTPFTGEKTNVEVQNRIMEQFGLNEPIHVQYFRYVKNLLCGDFGQSYSLQRGRMVSDIVFDAFKESLKLGVPAYLVSLVLGLILGVMAGTGKSKHLARLIEGFYVVCFSIPSYVFAILICLILCVLTKTFPMLYLEPGGYFPPFILLVILTTSSITMITAVSVRENNNKDFVRAMKARGIPEKRIRIHITRNSLGSILPVAATTCANIITGSIVAETLFTVPGLGRYFISAISARDYMVIMAVTLIYTLLYVGLHFVFDIFAAFADHRHCSKSN